MKISFLRYHYASKIMRLTGVTMILVTALLSIAQAGVVSGQNVLEYRLSLKEKDQPLPAVLKKIQKTAGVTGLVMTKLDGTARGGILVAIASKFQLPVHFIGVGEGVDDLAPFAARDFAKAIAGLE